MIVWTLLLSAQVGSADLSVQVDESLTSVSFNLQVRLPRPEAGGTLYVHFPANHTAKLPDPLAAASERDAFVASFQPGGFHDVAIEIDGVACRAPQAFARRVSCGEFGSGNSVTAQVRGRFEVPKRYGPVGVLHGQLTLGGGWHPVVSWSKKESPQLDFRLSYDGPAGHPIVWGRRYRPPPFESTGRHAVTERVRGRSVPLVVLPPHARARRVAKNARLISLRAGRLSDQDFDLGYRESAKAMQDALLFLQEQDLAKQSPPILVVEAPLRHELVRALPGMVLISDRAYRLLPFERFLRFHRFPLVREVFTAWALAQHDAHDVVAAEATGAWLQSQYIADRAGRAENAWDVLGFWSFLPTVDSILYAPQLPFVSAYFRVLGGSDPLVQPLVDPVSQDPHGRLLHDKLRDRLSKASLHAVFDSVLAGRTLRQASEPQLQSATERFFTTWYGPTPKVQYVLTTYSSRRGLVDECDNCWVAEATIERRGETIEEPIEVLFVDDAGLKRIVRSEATDAEVRTVTATMSAELNEVFIDPDERLYEAPSPDNPSPRLDNRSHPRWRWLLNNIDFTFSPSSGNLSMAVDIGLSRRLDLRWRFGLRAFYGPDAYGGAARAVYGFGDLATPGRLDQWIGFGASAQRLRADFGGSEDEASATSASIFYGYDNRQTLWAPEPGTALRFAVGYDHVFSSTLVDGQTPGALSFAASALRSWRLDAAHQLSLRASLGSFIAGRPRPQQLFVVGGRRYVRGYVEDDALGRVRALVSGEWVHPILSELDWNGVWLGWITGLDGAAFADVAAIDDSWGQLSRRSLRADVGYGVRLYLDYFGVQEGVVALDVAVPLLNDQGQLSVGGFQIYIDFVQSYFVF